MSDDQDAATGDTEDRIDRIEAAQQEQKGLLDQILSKLAGSAPAAPAGATRLTEARLSADETIAAEVQRELDRRDEKVKAKQRDEEFASVKETVAKLTEKTPEPPVRRVESLMGWH